VTAAGATAPLRRYATAPPRHRATTPENAPTRRVTRCVLAATRLQATQQLQLAPRVLRVRTRPGAAQALERCAEQVETRTLAGVDLRPHVGGHGSGSAAPIAAPAGEGEVLGECVTVPRSGQEVLGGEIRSPWRATAPNADPAVPSDQAV